MDLFSLDARAQTWPIPSDVAHVLAIKFGLTVMDVRIDARDLATWHDPDEQDLLRAVAARRKLDPLKTTRYIWGLRSSLRD